MTQVCLHPKGAIVVPETAVPAFSHAILPKPELAVTLPPKTLKGKILRGFQKSTLITAPVVAVGGIGGMMAAPLFLEFTVANALVVLVGGMVTSVFGMGGTLCAVDSLNKGDRNWTPLPPTKKYLELEARKQESVIQPFKNWDEVFDRTNRKS